ncbi:NAD(P)H-dependent oxidoreductase [Planococcus maitriensis]|uniref:NADPH-dependent FMN reductase-like domain-containing protein n=1 Tax=Planococcus maitriensis TaxID=221799 RepID=A0A365K3U5_9BACL|nr:NAD(P)H-dependent oxidoreductase [Planococcus maitriensis]RAZ67284.1 hypothetical protein DP119_10995 [Planococcus maitriensis]
MKKITIIAASRNEQSRVMDITREMLHREDLERYETVCITPENFRVAPPSGQKDIFSRGMVEEDARLKDDMPAIRHHLLTSELIVVVSPVYSHNIPGDLKNLIDRISNWTHLFALAVTPVFLLVTAESNGAPFVMSYLEKVFTAMGATILHEDVFLLTEPERAAEKMEELHQKISYVLEKPLLYGPNSVQEALFQSLKEIIRQYPADHYEYKYWKEQGMFQDNTLEDHFRKKQPLDAL